MFVNVVADELFLISNSDFHLNLTYLLNLTFKF